MSHKVEVYLSHDTYGPVVEKRVALVAELSGMEYAGGVMVRGCGDYAHSYRGAADAAEKFMAGVAGLGFECASCEVPS
jgi:hypothetical protein